MVCGRGDFIQYMAIVGHRLPRNTCEDDYSHLGEPFPALLEPRHAARIFDSVDLCRSS